MRKYDLPIDENIVNRAVMFATAAVGNFPFAGSAGADSVFARTVWKTIYGACPAMRSPGNARTVGDRTDSAISEGPTLCGSAEYEQRLANIRI